MTDTTEAAPSRAPFVVTMIATGLGAGFVPVAPGTAGTLVAVPMAWAAGKMGLWGYLILCAGVTALAIWAADVYGEATRTEDNQRIVVDEIVGYLVTMAPVPRGPFNLLAGFVLFRLLDTWKPWPLRCVDEHLEGGLGVVLDDLGAGIYSGAILYLLDRLDVVRLLASSVGLQP